MTPDFALTLSFDGISLLRRVSGDWVTLGDVALDVDDLRGALAELRAEADAVSPEGGQVKLIIPNEQIKYLSLPNTAQSDADLQTDIRAALDGSTPYAVDDLRFDWSILDGWVYVAAVANETLDEAEAFAKSHHFDPVAFGAIAPEGQFSGDVFFGAAATWAGPAPERDTDAVLVLPAEAAIDLSSKKDTATSDALAVGRADPATLAEESAKTQPAAADTTPTDSDVPDDVAASRIPSTADPGNAEPEDSAAPTPSLRMEPPQAPNPLSFASIRASRDATNTSDAPTAPPVAGVSASTEVPSEPRFKLGGARKSTDDTDITAPALQVEDTEGSGTERRGFGFFSRRKPAPATAEPPAPDATVAATRNSAEEATPPPRKHDPEPARAAVARIAAMRAQHPPESEIQDTAIASERQPIASERQRMTIFGARTEPEIGGKPRFLGLILTSALLVFLLAVAAWASVFLDEGISRFLDRDTDTPSIARMPDVQFEPLDGPVTAPADGEEPTELAALDTGEGLAPPNDGLSNLMPPPPALTSEEAEARYAATGIWQRSPQPPDTPRQTTLDDLYIASIDGSVQQFDAVALPAAQALRNDRTYLSQPNPAAPGTDFTLDERGLVVATPEGAINPYGVRIFTGPPPVVPPNRPAPPETDPEPQEDEQTASRDPALAETRPKSRPDGLIENNERAQLAGRTLAELAALRPNPRPETLKAEQEEAQPAATKFAVVESAAPVNRPRNFSTIVQQTREAQQQRPAEATQVAAVAPRTVQPRVPSTANVSRQATVSNAINLRRINLIGVYGKPASRRALVRLSNGRYQKVQVGDRLDGGRVAAIGESQLRIAKNGRNMVLDMPDG